MMVCEHADCAVPSFASLVWPGRGRIHYCIIHFNAAVSVLTTIGMDPKTCDPRLTDAENPPGLVEGLCPECGHHLYGHAQGDALKGSVTAPCAICGCRFVVDREKGTSGT